MSHRVEFFFDCSSPWTYLAFEAVQRRLADLDVTIAWKPILVGGIFNTINPSVYASRDTPVPAKAAYARKDLQDWARYVGLEIGAPEVFPVNSVKAMRGAFFAIEKDCLVPYARAVFKRYWSDLADISQADVLAEVATGVGLNADEFLAAIGAQRYKDLLRTTTDEVVTRGGFGTPTMFLNETEMFFGNDRIELLRARIEELG
jgi:2-hydroxychromene-2-carboxylate isomerase